MKGIAEKWRWRGLLVFLLAGGAFIHIWQRAGEAAIARQALHNLPAVVGQWRQTGPDERFDAETEQVLGADDYLARRYADATGTSLSFYVGYYASQRQGRTYHSPLNCLPGAGWTMSDYQNLTVPPVDGNTPFSVNRYVVTNGVQREVILYWYQGRGRAVASEYWGKIYTVLDSVRYRRSDGAMVRVMVPATTSDDQATQTALTFAAQIAPRLSAYIPD